MIGQNTFDNAVVMADRIYFPQSFSVFRDVGVDSLLLDSVYNYGTIKTPQAKITNLGTISQTPLIKLRIGSFYRDSLQQSISPGIHTLSFRPCTLNTEGTLLAVCKSILQGDTNTGNDSAYKNIRVREQGIPDTNDIGIEAILAPTGTLYLGNSVIPKTIIKNFGNVTKNSFNVIYTIGLSDIKSGEFVDTLFIDSLQPGKIDTLEFDNYLANTLGIFATRSKILSSDDNPLNDTMSGAGFEVIESIIPPQPPTPGWHQKRDVPTHILGKYVKDGGALVVTATPAETAFYALKGDRSKEFYKYIPGNPGTWTEKESVPFTGKVVADTYYITPQKKFPGKDAALCWDGNDIIYAIKGNGTREFWAYSIAGDNWAKKHPTPSLKGVKGGSDIVYHNNKVCLLNGSVPKPDSNNFFEYDPLSDNWTVLPIQLPTGPYNKTWKDGSCLTVATNGKIYALKGSDKQGYFYEIDGASLTEKESIPKYDTMATTPRVLKKTCTPKDGADIVAIDDKIYGEKGGGAWKFWEYDITSNRWAQSPGETIPRLNNKSYARTGADMVSVAGNAWLMKGNNTPEFWQYVPSEETKRLENNYKYSSNVYTTIQDALNLEKKPIGTTIVRQGGFLLINYQDTEYKIYNASGEKIGQGNTSRGAINLRRYCPGVYFLRIENQNKPISRKIIIE